MRGQEIPFLGNQITVNDINDSPVIIVIDHGKAKRYNAPDYGETVIITQDATVQRIRVLESEKF